jgi:ATP-dependent DNA helicase RecG
VPIENLQQRQPIHESRNPRVARVLAELGLMREQGEGIPRMFEEMERSFLHAPAFVVEAAEFRVTLKNEPVFEGPSSEWQHVVQGLRLSPGQKRVLLAKPEGFTNEDYRRLNDVDRDQAYREIQEMVELGVAASTGAHGRGAAYRVASGLHEARGFLESRLSVLRDHLNVRSWVTNADYRALFGVSRAGTKREIRRLVDAGFLRLEGLGRGARYLAGPSLR